MDAQCLAQRLAVWTLVAITVTFGSLMGRTQATAQEATTAPSASEQGQVDAESISRWTSRQRSFEIPFQLAEGDTTTVVELYYSFNGEAWQLYERRRGNDSKFIFKAESDGAYWFTSRTIDAQNRPSPTGPLSAELLVIVDATAPQVDFKLETGDTADVQCSWQIEDPGLAPLSLTLEYEADGNWQPITVQLPPQQTREGVTSMRGGVTWRPREGTTSPQVRLSIRDAAGNLTQEVKTVKLTTASSVPNPSASAAANSVPRPSRQAASPDKASPPPQAPVAGVPWRNGSQPEAVKKSETEEVAASPYHQRDPAPRPSAGMAETLPAPAGKSTTAPAAEVANRQAADAYQLPAPKEKSRYGRSPATTTDGGASSSQGQSLAASAGATPWNAQTKPSAQQSVYGNRKGSTPAKTNPVAGPIQPAVTKRASQDSDIAEMLFGDLAVESTNATAFQLDYDIESVGPDGVAKVELWVTRNRGQDWEQYAEDPDFVSPIDVEVSEEGLYGFRVQVTGKNGLGAQPPKSGDQADIWIAIDTTKPTVELNNVPYGRGPTAGKLEIYWTAEDKNLAPRPITLRYSQSPTGPWTTIAASIPNEGKYLWAIEANTPKEVYLRLEVTDQAGNVGVAQLADPVRLQPLIPKARIRGFKPVSRVELGTRQQTALLP